MSLSRTLKVRGGIISQANRYLGGFCSSQGIFPPQIIQVLLHVPLHHSIGDRGNAGGGVHLYKRLNSFTLCLVNGLCYSREADRSTSRCSRTERARFRALRSSVPCCLSRIPTGRYSPCSRVFASWQCPWRACRLA